MIKYVILVSLIFLNSACTTFRTTGEPRITETVVTPIKEVKPKKAIGRYDIDLNQELSYGKEVDQINQLNQMSVDTNNKTSQQQLLDSLFANKNRSPKNIRTSYLKISREKKRALRKKISHKRSVFFNDQKLRRSKYLAEAKIKKEKFRKGKPSSIDKKEFYKDLDLQRKHFFATERDEKKIFDSNIKSLEKEIEARFKDLDKEFEDYLKIYKSTYENP